MLTRSHANAVLRLFGLAIVEMRIGHWSTGADGRLQRRTTVYGYRLGSRRDLVEGDGETALDRFFRSRR